MAIRFTCPSCNQPLEVDDAWAGQTVGCPYCRRVATAPMNTTWSGAEIRMASPAPQAPTSAFTPPPPPGGYASMAPPPVYVRTSPPGGSSAVGAFVLTLAGTLMAVAGYMVFLASWGLAAEQKAGPNATQQQLQEAMREMMTSGQVQLVPTAAIAFFAIGLFLGVVGLVLAIRSLLRQESKRGLAIAACILGACVTLCQILPMLGAMATRATVHPQ